MIAQQIGKRFRHENSSRVWTVTAASSCGTVLEISSNDVTRRLPAVALNSDALVFLPSREPVRVDALPYSVGREWTDVETGTWTMTQQGVFAQ